MKKINAQISQSDIQQALKSTDVEIGAEFEFLFNKENVSAKPRNIKLQALEILEKAARNSINTSAWIKGREHTYKGGWTLEYDKSLPYNNGAELITPPLPLSKFLTICPLILNAINVIGKTTNACGLHLNISIKGQFNVNPLKLALYIDEDLVYSFFNKKARSAYAGPIKGLLRDILMAERAVSIKDIKYLESRLKVAIESSLKKYLTKDYGINSGKLEEGYIEFRYTGGANYQNKWSKIESLIGMYIFILKIALDKNYKKDEYRVKVSKLLKKELKHQKTLIEDTKPWVEFIQDFLKYFNLKLKTIKRSPRFIYVYVEGKEKIINEAAAILGIPIDKDVMKIPVSDISVKERLSKKDYTKIAHRFTIKGDNYIIDNRTDLMWSRNSLGKMTWEKAVKLVSTLKLGGYTDWRLPTIDELESIKYTGSTPGEEFWSSSIVIMQDNGDISSHNIKSVEDYKKYFNKIHGINCMDLKEGYIYVHRKEDEYSVLAVRIALKKKE